MQYAVIFFLVTGFTSCSDDDINNDRNVTASLPTGTIYIDEWGFLSLSGNILTVSSVTVGQDSWLAAVRVGDERSNNFVARPVFVEKGTTDNIELLFDDSIRNYSKSYAEAVLKLYADNPNGGIIGEWDPSDKPIVINNNVLVLRKITFITFTGWIMIGDYYSLSGNILTVPSVEVGQDSWLAAVPEGEEQSNNFVAKPVFVEQGTTDNIELIFDDSVVNYTKIYAGVVLKLYVDNKDGGLIGEWDESDKPILNHYNRLLTWKITISADLTNYDPFRHFFDSNGDGSLDPDEVSKTYPNRFQEIWDINDDGYIDREEFLRMTFLNADFDLNSEISIEEWNEGYLRMFRKWVNNDFSGYDEDKNEKLNQEEWINIIEKSEWFENYDTNSDNLITEQELNEGFFGDWDLNGNGKIEEEEFNNYQPYVSMWWYGDL